MPGYPIPIPWEYLASRYFKTNMPPGAGLAAGNEGQDNTRDSIDPRAKLTLPAEANQNQAAGDFSSQSFPFSSPTSSGAPQPLPFPGQAPPYAGLNFTPEYMGWNPMGMGGGVGGYPYTGPTSLGSQPPGTGNFNDPYNVYLSSIPVLQNAMKDRINEAAAQAGAMGGGRFGTAFNKQAAEIGAEAGLQQTQMLNDLLYNHSQRAEDRSLQATMGQLGYGLEAARAGSQLGSILEEIQRGRLQDLGQMGQYEQSRQDMFGQTALQDFQQNQLGYLPLLLQAAMSQGAGYQPSPVTYTEGGSPGLLDYAAQIGPLFAPGGAFAPLLAGLFQK